MGRELRWEKRLEGGGEGQIMRILSCGPDSMANGEPSKAFEHMSDAIRVVLAALWRWISGGPLETREPFRRILQWCRGKMIRPELGK